MSTPPHAPPHAPPKPPPFEFTKRKHWADLLIAELADAIALVLSPTYTILYCGPAVTALLGWRDADLVDADLLSLVAAPDQAPLRAALDDSLRTRAPLVAHARLKAARAPAPDVLFELRAHPHFPSPAPHAPCACLFAVAKPAPGRNTVLLDTFLPLKLENERLQQRVVALRARALRLPGAPYPAPPASAPAPAPAPPPAVEPPSFAGGSRFGAPADDDGDDGARKRARKGGAEQHVCVTCGRTDSPEWRKGPLGPKTLCNACGLRWAKQVRRFDADAGEGARASMGPA